jgi:hypothetical protein
VKPLFEHALLTGATGGLGQELTKILLREQIPLTRTGRDASKCQIEIPCDLLRPEPILQFIEEKAPDLVINNAGFTLYGDAINRSQQEIFEVNASAVFKITLAAAKRLKELGRSGVVLNVSSAAALLSFPGMATYAAAKAFVASFSQSLDAEMRPYGIRVLTTLPGPIKTPFASHAAGHPYKESPLSLSAQRAANRIWKQILSKKNYQIIDWRTRLLLQLARLLPRKQVENYLHKEIINRSKLK